MMFPGTVAFQVSVSNPEDLPTRHNWIAAETISRMALKGEKPYRCGVCSNILT